MSKENLPALTSKSKELIKLYAKTRDFHNEMYVSLLDLRDGATEDADPDVCADVAFVMNKISKMCEDLRKECDKANYVVKRVGCLLKATSCDPQPMRGQLCTGTPTSTTVVKVPDFKNSPEECRELMKGLGIPEELYKDGAVRPHWPAMVQTLSDRISSGIPLPEGSDGTKTYNKYNITCRKVKGADLDALASTLENENG